MGEFFSPLHQAGSLWYQQKVKMDKGEKGFGSLVAPLPSWSWEKAVGLRVARGTSRRKTELKLVTLNFPFVSIRNN